jgi:transcription antitermination protein NusB
MARRRAREFALKALYQVDVSGGTCGAALEGLWRGQLDGAGEERAAEDGEIEFAGRIASGVDEKQDEIDALIEKASKNWRLIRMPVVDRNILRMATAELLFFEDVPASVTINEAVELAKRFGDKDSRAFVNGILDRIASILGRGGRHHSQA